ncbi:MAG: hypothetical protein ACYCYF_14590 [Anaerolineae bacterium]
MNRSTRMALALGLPAGVFFSAALVLGRPRPGEPRLLTRLRLNMVGEALGVFGYGLWHPHLLRTGASAAERAMALPGDALVPDPNYRLTCAIDIGVPPEKVWPWLSQMGDGRASWYAWSPLHELPEYGRASPTYLNPAWQNLEVGQVLLDGDVLNDCDEGKGAWRVVEVQPEHAIVYYSARELLQGLEFDAGSTRPRGMYAVTSWAFVLRRVAQDRTRLLIRVRAEAGPPVLVPLALLIFGGYDRVWEHTLLEGVRFRAERCQGNRPPET